MTAPVLSPYLFAPPYSFTRSIPVLQLNEELGKCVGMHYLTTLWAWCAEYSSTGRFPADVADIHGVALQVNDLADFRSRSDRAARALVSTGWIVRLDDRFSRVVPWQERYPEYAATHPLSEALAALNESRLPQEWSRKHVAAAYARDGAVCRYCGATDVPLSIDHVVPRSQGGRDDLDNLVVCCRPCNSRKGGRTPEQAGMRLRALPEAS